MSTEPVQPRPATVGELLDTALALDEQSIEACSDQIERLKAELAKQAVDIAEIRATMAWLQRRVDHLPK